MIRRRFLAAGNHIFCLELNVVVKEVYFKHCKALLKPPGACNFGHCPSPFLAGRCLFDIFSIARALIQAGRLLFEGDACSRIYNFLNLACDSKIVLLAIFCFGRYPTAADVCT